MNGSDFDSPGSATNHVSATDKAVAWVHGHDAGAEVVAAVRRRVRERRQRRLGALALVLLLGGSVAAWNWPSRPLPPTQVKVAAAAVTITQPEQLALPDGSIVALKNGAKVTYDFSGPWRRVRLEQGEAHFQVAKNPERPFVVAADGVEVRAVGTAFAVHASSQGVQVLVTEGRVAVGRAASMPPPDLNDAADATYLGAGQRVVVEASGGASAVETLSHEEVSQQLLWRVPQLELSRTSVGEILELINRHASAAGKKRVVIAPESAELRDVQLSGLLSADNAEGLVRMLQANLKVVAEESGDAILVRKPAR